MKRQNKHSPAVIALGEFLMDMTPVGDEGEGSCYRPHPGGAPPNLLVQLARLGHSTAFIGKVGDDVFGHQLRDLLVKEGIDIQGLSIDPVNPTTLAFVHLDERGDRSFSFYRSHCADVTLDSKDIPRDLVEKATIAHFGSLSLTEEPSRSATLHYLETAKTAETIISYDPNLRMGLWPSEDAAKMAILQGMSYAKIVKVSDDELKFLTGLDDIADGAKVLRQDFPDIQVLLVTSGPAGSDLFIDSGRWHEEPLDVPVVDTTGAGDSFFAGFLHGLLSASPQGYPKDVPLESWGSIMHFANQAASRVVMYKGAIPAMGKLEQILQVESMSTNSLKSSPE